MLKIYSSNDEATYLDTSGTRTLYEGHNKRNNRGVVDTIWIRNDEPTEWLSDISIYATSTRINLTTGNDGFGIKFYYGSLEPSERVWNSLAWNNSVSIPNIGTSASADTSFKKIWIRTEIAPYIDVGMYDASIVASYIKHPV